MANVQPIAPLASDLSRERITSHPVGGVAFDLIAAMLSLWFVLGLFIDGWVHNNNIVDNTFFTPWHAILYSGVLVNGLFLAINQYRNVTRGYVWTKALPKGYLVSLIGVVIFFLGGGVDFVWHEIFGFEANIEALMSPAHLLLAFSAFLFVSGPIRAAWSRKDGKTGWTAFFPLILSATLLLSMFTFFTQFANLFRNTWFVIAEPYSRDTFFLDVIGIVGAVVPSALTIGILLFIVRPWGNKLPFGTVTFIVSVNTLLMFWLQLDLEFTRPMYIPYLVAAPLAGLVGDALLKIFKPMETEQMWALRVFSFSVPFVLFATAYIILDRISGMWWALHLSLGTVFFAAFAGLLLSYLLIPPRVEMQ